MSTYNAIHDLSETLRGILDRRFNPVPPRRATITVDSPHKENAELPRVNLFLYQILPDANNRNIFRVAVGEPVNGRQQFASEPLALIFRYLVTAFAADGLSEHRLLGEAMLVLHEKATIPEEDLRGTLRDDPIRPSRVDIVLQALDLASINNIWGNNVALLRASVAYEVAMVFINSDARKVVPLVAERPHPEVVPVPYLESIYPAQARPGEVVRIYGANLALDYLGIWLGGSETVPLEDARPGVARVTLPADLPPGRRRVFLQLDRYRSRSVEFEVLSP